MLGITVAFTIAASVTVAPDPPVIEQTTWCEWRDCISNKLYWMEQDLGLELEYHEKNLTCVALGETAVVRAVLSCKGVPHIFEGWMIPTHNCFPVPANWEPECVAVPVGPSVEDRIKCQGGCQPPN